MAIALVASVSVVGYGPTSGIDTTGANLLPRLLTIPSSFAVP